MAAIKQLNSKVSALQGDSSYLPLTLLSKQKSHQQCMICGPKSVLGLKIDFYSSINEVWAITKASLHQQGYQGIMHGGFLAALLDAAMCQAIFSQNIEAVTADMNIRFLHEVPVNSELLIRGEIASRHCTLYKVKAEIYVDNQLVVKADARFMKKKLKDEK